MLSLKYWPELCDGSRSIPAAVVDHGSRPRGICGACKGEYAVNQDGTLQFHRRPR